MIPRVGSLVKFQGRYEDVYYGVVIENDIRAKHFNYPVKCRILISHVTPNFLFYNPEARDVPLLKVGDVVLIPYVSLGVVSDD